MYLYHKSLSTAFLDLLGRELTPEFSELSSEFWLVVVVLPSEVGVEEEEAEDLREVEETLFRWTVGGILSRMLLTSTTAFFGRPRPLLIPSSEGSEGTGDSVLGVSAPFLLSRSSRLVASITFSTTASSMLVIVTFLSERSSGVAGGVGALGVPGELLFFPLHIRLWRTSLAFLLIIIRHFGHWLDTVVFPLLG